MDSAAPSDAQFGSACASAAKPDGFGFPVTLSGFDYGCSVLFGPQMPQFSACIVFNFHLSVTLFVS